MVQVAAALQTCVKAAMNSAIALSLPAAVVAAVSQTQCSTPVMAATAERLALREPASRWAGTAARAVRNIVAEKVAQAAIPSCATQGGITANSASAVSAATASSQVAAAVAAVATMVAVAAEERMARAPPAAVAAAEVLLT